MKARKFYTDLENYQPEMLKIARRYSSKNFAEDIAQEASIKMIKNLEKFDDNKGNFRHWASVITKNTAISYMKKEAMRMPFELHEDECIAPNESNDTTLELEGIFLLSIKDLTFKKRRIMLMLYKGLKANEIAKKLGLSAATISEHVKQSKAHIRNSRFKQEY